MENSSDLKPETDASIGRGLTYVAFAIIASALLLIGYFVYEKSSEQRKSDQRAKIERVLGY